MVLYNILLTKITKCDKHNLSTTIDPTLTKTSERKMVKQNIKPNELIMLCVGLFGIVMISISTMHTLSIAEIGLCIIVGLLSVLIITGIIRDHFNLNIPLINHIISSKNK